MGRPKRPAARVSIGYAGQGPNGENDSAVVFIAEVKPAAKRGAERDTVQALRAALADNLDDGDAALYDPIKMPNGRACMFVSTNRNQLTPLPLNTHIGRDAATKIVIQDVVPVLRRFMPEGEKIVVTDDQAFHGA